ncbi:3-hydroxyisobutyrate dehydrogenase [Burkholderia gladioli]|uniref:3-hydroxyisobutyrate dehydrogenase n=1 Tax=Burkholderia gladioli TaxID=28095 RepID=UPI001642081E|nr:3-hydroxyisobutyrate dehydrogenase [Burkholderia gladioli]MBU9645605.1 3-hydroxyisobutyrate dehydrogenase [Burkholderia gladioli]MDN7808758.1 3-hydroxyisobutyrate dehydrogenase [Burkholderia gladioli]
MKIGFIGLGHMGAPMALNLVKAGHEVRAFDLSEDALRLVADGGATLAGSAREVAEGAEFVITMLPAAVHVRRALTDENGVLAGLAPGATVIDSSTIDPASAQAFGELVRERGGAFVDAPVSGGTGGAAAGTLTFMVGGSVAEFKRVTPVLSGMGRNVVHCGPTGMGQVAKVCNNLVLGISMAGVAEAMSLGVALGIDPKVLGGILNTSTGRCWSADTYNPYPGVIETAPSSRGYTGGFGTDLMLKDLGLANDAAKQVRQPVYLGALAQQLYQTVSSRGDGRLDFSAVIRLYQMPASKDSR